MKLLFTFILSAISVTFSYGQNKTAYTPEDLLELLGRTDLSLEMKNFKSVLHLSESLNIDKIITKKTRKEWESADLYLFYTEDKEFGENIHLVEEIHFTMDLKSRVNPKLEIEKGFLGVTPGMKKKDVEAILATIDSDFEPSSTTVSKAKNKSGNELVFYFTSVKANGKLESITIRSSSKSLIYALKDNFVKYGLSEIVPEEVIKRYNTNKDYFYYINAIPKKGCASCIYVSRNTTVSLTDTKQFDGQLSGLAIKGKLTITINGEPNFYTGEFINGEAQGKGILEFFDNSVIIGYWENGLLYKTDRMDMDGLNYIGEVKADFTMHGIGTLISYSDGKSVAGRFENHNLVLTEKYKVVNTKDKYSYVGTINSDLLPNGSGTIIWENGESQSGNFENGKFLGGLTKIKLDNGKEYRGEVNSQNSPNGQGGYYYEDGQFYRGVFIDGAYQGGTGKINYGDGVTYEGSLNKNKKPEGEGELTSVDGSLINGTFSSEGKFLKGFGKKVFSEGVYTGAFGPDVTMQGKGNFSFKNRQYVNGIFYNNKFTEGTGKIYFESGQRYEGALNGEYKPNGWGTQYFSDNNYLYGYFKNGKFTASNGTRLWSNGTKFAGPLNVKGEPNGYGTLTSLHYSIKGTFKGNTAIGTVEATYYSIGNTWIWSGGLDSNLKPHGAGKAKQQYSTEWKNITYNHGVMQ